MGKKIVFLIFLLAFIFLTNFISAFNWNDSSLVAYYDLNSSITSDLTGHGYNLTDYNVTYFQPGVIGNSANYTGIGTSVGSMGEFNGNLGILDYPFTFSFWIRGSTSPLVINTPIAFGNTDTVQKATIYTDSTGNLFLSVRNSSNLASTIESGVNVVNGSWFYITGEFNSPTDRTLWVNGVLVGEKSDSVTYTAPDHFAIGADPSNTLGSVLWPWTGGIDEVSVWNKTLNSTEIQDLYNNGNGLTYGQQPSPVNRGYIYWDNESILNVNSSVWWAGLNGFNTTQLVNTMGKLTINTNWLNLFITNIINNTVNFSYIRNLGFYPSSNPSGFYNATNPPPIPSGISFTYYNLTTMDVTTNNSTRYNATVISLLLTAGKKISIECNLLVDSAAATTGIQFSSNVSSTSSRRQVIEYYSSATTEAICQGTTEGLLCNPTTSAGTTVTPTRISIYTVQSNNSQFTLNLKSEVAGSAVNVRAGSWCRSLEI